MHTFNMILVIFLFAFCLYGFAALVSDTVWKRDKLNIWIVAIVNKFKK